MGEQIELQTILLLLKKIWGYLVAVALICGAVGYAVSSFLITPIYQSTATVLVHSTSDAQNSNVTMTTINSSIALVNIYGQVIKSDLVLQPVIDRLGLNMTTTQLMNRITVSSIDETPVMQITVRGPDNDENFALVNAIVEESPDQIKEAISSVVGTKVISPPKQTDSPISPNKKKNAATAALLGVIVCFAFFFIRQLLDNTIKTAEDITTRFNLPVIGVIPETESTLK